MLNSDEKIPSSKDQFLKYSASLFQKVCIWMRIFDCLKGGLIMYGINQIIYNNYMSSNRPGESLPQNQLSDSTFDSHYSPQNDDQSPINQNSHATHQYSPQRLRYTHSHPRQPHQNGKSEMMFFIVVAILVIAIGYFLNDNRIQQKEIASIMINIQNTKNPQATIPIQKQPLVQKTASKLNLIDIAPAPTEASAINNAQTKKELNPEVSALSHQQIKLKNYLYDQIPKRIWHFNTKIFEKSSLWTQKCYQQHNRKAVKLNYEFFSINSSNYAQYLPEDRYLSIRQSISNLDARYEARNEPELIKYKDLLIKQIISMEVLLENGGIFIDEDILLTENFTWIESISSNPQINAKQWIEKALFIAFHSVELSTPIQKYQNYPAQAQNEEYIVLYPAISSSFLAANKNNHFLKELLNQYYSLLKNPSEIKNFLKNLQINIGGFQNEHNSYKRIFEAASLITLHKKQRQLESKGKTAIQHFQIATINQNYGPTKIKAYLTIQPVDKIFNHLSRITRQQLEYQFGELRYFVNIEPKEDMYVILLEYIQNNMIIEQSLIHQALFDLSKDAFIEHVKPEIRTSEPWDSLPAKVWTYFQENKQNVYLFDQIWLQNLKKVAQESKFELIILTEQTIPKYLSKEVIKSIEDAINPTRTKLKVYASTKKTMISLAILYEYGGVWIDQEVYPLDSFEWLRNINKEPYLWNKYGKNPKVIMSFQPHYGSPFVWKYDAAGIKESWHLAYQISFIAAVPKAQLFQDWLNQYIIDLAIPFQDLLAKFYRCKIHLHRWISDGKHDMLPQDCIKCVLGAKKVELATEGKATSPNQYYGLWAINGFTGFLKMREYTNFISGRNMENPFIWRYSFEQMQTLTGSVNHMVRLYSYTTHKLRYLLEENLNNPSKQIHKQSFIMNLLAKINGKVVMSKKGLYLQSWLLNQRNQFKKKEEFEQLSKIPPIVWIYHGGQIATDDGLLRNMLENIQYYANMSNFTVRSIDRQTYQFWLPSNAREKISFFLSELQKKLNKEQSNLKDHYENIVGQYIILQTLYELGGVAINKKIVLHQSLDWIKNVEKISFINKGGKSPAKVLSFFAPGYSTKKTKVNNEQMVLFPSIENYFIASGKRTPFIYDLKQQFRHTIIQNQKCKQKLKQIGHNLGWLHGDDPYYQALFLASQFTINKKEKELTEHKSKQNALDYYGLYSLNSLHHAYKLHNFLNSMQVNDKNVDQYLGKTTLAELEMQIGPLKYLSIIPKSNEVKNYITKNSFGQNGYSIMEKSFLHEYLTLDSQKNGIIKYTSPPPQANHKQWASLPLDVWIYIPKGLPSSKLITQLMFLHLKNTFALAGIKVHEITQTNFQQQLDKKLTQRIQKIITQKNNENHKQSIIKLAILQKYGGVFIRSNMLAIEKPSWIKNIANVSSELVFNKFDAHPKVLMFVDSLRSTNNWNYSQGTKVGHELGWIEDLIASEKDSELIKEWLNLMLDYLQSDSKQQAKLLEECGIKENKRSKNSPSMLSLDILQCVLNRRHAKLAKQKNKKQTCQDFGLWGISQYLGPAKFEEQINLESIENDLNPFLWKWNSSEAQSLIGKISFMARLTNKQLLLIQQLIVKQKLKDWGNNRSFLVKVLQSSIKGSLVEKDGKVVIKA